jgi:hypothetical protein
MATLADSYKLNLVRVTIMMKCVKFIMCIIPRRCMVVAVGLTSPD